MQYKRIMGIDYGDVRIGIALSDLMQIIASPLEVYKTKNTIDDVNYLCNLIKQNQVETVVFGLPLNMDGTEGERAKITRLFASKIANQSGVRVVFQDERLSSVEAEDILIQANVRREDRKKLIDKLSASIILESYLNRKE
ncbi:MAG: Holliday junction resolvase RuvX [Clostridia bacterium]|nr:Holliday junction resolvase RuvX [Clostridia bacterium]